MGDMLPSSRHTCSCRDLPGQRVIIVGAGAFGVESAKALIDARCDVALVDISQDKLDLASATVDGRARFATADVTSRDEAMRVVDELTHSLGGLDVLIHTVGTNDRQELEDITPSSWNHLLQTNLSSAIWCGQAAAAHMRANGSGSIIFFSSVSAVLGHPAHGAYAATKAGLSQFVKVMAIELAPDQIRVNAVAPGYTHTDLTAAYLSEEGRYAELAQLIPFGRLGTCEDLTGPVLFLASQQSEFVTGQTLLVDGGRTLD